VLSTGRLSILPVWSPDDRRQTESQFGTVLTTVVRRTTDMIQKHQVIPLLLSGCPDFWRRWQKHSALWNGQEAGIHSDLGEFATYVVDAYGSQNTEQVVVAFQIVERLLTDGDEEVRAAAAIGFLEDVQTIASNRPFGPQIFTQWLGPKSKEVWVEIAEKWRGKSSLIDGIRAEKAARNKKES